MTTMHFGYVRVSTQPQSIGTQVDKLVASGISADRIHSDKMSGAKADRPGLARLLEVAREGDTITVVALDRLGRSLLHVLETIDELNQRGIVLRSLREDLDFSTPTGKLMATIFSALAEYELCLIRERSAAAREAAAARGRRSGRPRVLTDEQVQLVQRLHQSGENIAAIGRTFGVSRASVYRALDRAAA